MRKDKSSGTSLMMVKLASAKFTRMKSSKLNASVAIIWERFMITILSECNSEGKNDGGMLICFFIHVLIMSKLHVVPLLSNYHWLKVRMELSQCPSRLKKVYVYKIFASFTHEVFTQLSSSTSCAIL